MDNTLLAKTAARNKNGVDYENLRSRTRVLITKPPDESPVCMEVIQEGHHYIVGSLGSITMIQGAKKARKTYYVSAYIASLLSGKRIIHHQGYLPWEKRRVLFFDTEQGSRSVRKVQSRIHAMAGLSTEEESDTFQYYSLRGTPMSLRSELINYCIEHTPELGAVIIDGGRDLIQSINDDGESFTIIDKLLNWSDKHQIHIVVVLHENPGSDKARGHLGTELGNKAESIIKLKKVDASYSQVESENREKDFPPFYFTCDENDFPAVADVEESKGRVDPRELDRNVHLNLLQEIYGEVEPSTTYSLSTLFPILKEKFRKYGFSFGDQKIKDLIKFYVAQEILENRSLGQGWKLTLKESRV